MSRDDLEAMFDEVSPSDADDDSDADSDDAGGSRYNGSVMGDGGYDG